uniref:AC6 protein n=1 Tax=Tomato leaf curl Joydebpur virus TaxID=309390 RepID=A0A1Y0DIX6_9GEMI|nr:AC6 protein [Tomato leaf curl Joydebpur virus]
MECISANNVCTKLKHNKIQYLLICYGIIEIDPYLQSSIHRVRGVSTRHVQHQCILTMVFILPSLLLVIHNIIINPNKLLHQSLLLRCVLTTCNGCMPLPEHLIPITMHVLHSSRTGLIIKHVKYLTKVLGLIYGPTISNKEKHNTIRVILSLDGLIHPYLAQNIDGLNTKPFTHSMGQPSSTSNIPNTHDFANVLDVMSGLKRWDLTWAFQSSRTIWASGHPGNPGPPGQGPVRPCFLFGEPEHGGSNPAGNWAVQIETAAYLRGGRGNDYICWSLRHNF